MTCALGPSLPPDVCRHLEDHDRYFSTERCYVHERPLDLKTSAGVRELGVFVRRRSNVCRRALTGWRAERFGDDLELARAREGRDFYVSQLREPSR